MQAHIDRLEKVDGMLEDLVGCGYIAGMLPVGQAKLRDARRALRLTIDLLCEDRAEREGSPGQMRVLDVGEYKEEDQ